jgi:hypothetical protein
LFHEEPGTAYHKNITKRLEIISTRLLDTQMGVDGGIPSGTSQVLVLPVRDMQVSLGVSVLFGETEINHVDLIASFPNAHEEIIRLDVSVNKVSRVDVFDSGNELVGEEKDSLEGEFSVTEIEQVL